MNKLVSLSPENVSYVANKANLLGKMHKFSEALNSIIDEHKKMRSLVEIKNEILSLRQDHIDYQIFETSSGNIEVRHATE